MHSNKRPTWIRNHILSVFIILFFVAIILVYYNMLVGEKRSGIIQDGEMSARQVETQFNEYLATCVDSIKLTAYTLDGMVADGRSGEEILSFLTDQSTAVINAVFENTMGVYGYVSGGYYDGGGWVPSEGFEPKTRPWYIEAAAKGGEVTLIDPYVDAQSGTVMMSLAKMLSDGDSVIAMDIYLDRIQEITESAVTSGASDIEVILDTRNMVVAHSDRGEVGKNYSDELGTLAAAMMESLSDADQTVFEFDYNDAHYIAYQAMLQNDWRCLSVKDATSVFKPLKRLLISTVAVISAVVFVLSAFLSSYNKNSRAIEDLTEETKLDKLTGFLNKAGTTSRMTELCRTEPGMLAILDLDNFKLINDLYGHDMGDRVLMTFADVVRQNTRSGDVLCRIGGDEFLIFCKNVTDERVMSNLTERLNGQFVFECRRLMGKDFNIPIGVSVGAVAVPEHGRDYRQLFSLADKALYRVKQSGKHSCSVYAAAQAPADSAEGLDGEMNRITQILEERGDSDDALWLGQDAFTSVYRFMLRSIRQNGGAAVKLLFTLCTAETGGDGSLSDAADCLGGILGEVLCAQDVILRSKPTQFFVLLPGPQHAETVAEQVLDAWQKTAYCKQFTVVYAAEEIGSHGANA